MIYKRCQPVAKRLDSNNCSVVRGMNLNKDLHFTKKPYSNDLIEHPQIQWTIVFNYSYNQSDKKQ